MLTPTATKIMTNFWLNLAEATDPIAADALTQFAPGDFVRWEDQGQVLRGRLRQVFDTGAIAGMDGPMDATPENPAALVEIWRPVVGGWVANGSVQGVKLRSLTPTEPLQSPPPDAAAFAESSPPDDPLAPLIARVASEVSSLQSMHLATLENRCRAIASQDLSDRAKFAAMRANFTEIDPQDMADSLARSLLVAWFGGEQDIQDSL